jgi:hypothetical protein
LSEPAGWDRARPWVLSLVIMALGATGIVVPPQLSARVLPSVSGAAPGSAATDAGSSSEYDMFAQPTIPALPAPLTASAAGWPLPLASYVKATWKPQTYRAWLDLWHGDRVEAPAPTDAQRHSWYVAHRNEFVDEYATTNPREDFAESFASWCLDVPVRSAARGKTTFFDDRPELVAMKQRCAALS